MRPDDQRIPEDLKADLAALTIALSKGKVSAALVASAVEKIARLPPANVASLDLSIADAAELWRYTEGPRLWPLTRFATTHSAQLLRTPGLELLFLFHRDGFLREAALKRTTGALPGPFFVAAITWRMNDWVAEVREAAIACAGRCFPQIAPAHLAQAILALAAHRQSWRRWNSEASVLRSAAADPTVLREMAALLKSGRTGLSAAFRQILRQDGFDRYLPELAEAAVQPAIRAIAMQSMIDREARWPKGYRWEWIVKAYGLRRRVPDFDSRPVACEASREDLITAASRDKSAALRRIALSAAIKYLAAEPLTLELANRLKDDPSAAVRSRAAFIIGGCGSE